MCCDRCNLSGRESGARVCEARKELWITHVFERFSWDSPPENKPSQEG